MNHCEICNNETIAVAAVVNGRYYKYICRNCLSKSRKVNSGHARWARSVDLEDHEHEIQQPYNADGTINTRFAKLYPEQAKALFTPDQLRDAELK